MTPISPSVAVYSAQGLWTAANAPDRLTALQDWARRQTATQLALDLSQVEFMDSAGLTVMIKTFRLAQSLGKEFRLCRPSPALRILLEVTQLDRGLAIDPDVSPALPQAA
ncbi:MAG: anti-sigma factor antagonist [Cyanobacteria bacterium RI_101]|jgi:anti-anti-sigma factor|nr:anti-sigma factor antagonist [Cyanobacteria bacterium RI_101]